jgi:hypothetical protein
MIACILMTLSPLYTRTVYECYQLTSEDEFFQVISPNPGDAT